MFCMLPGISHMLIKPQIQTCHPTPDTCCKLRARWLPLVSETCVYACRCLEQMSGFAAKVQLTADSALVAQQFYSQCSTTRNPVLCSQVQDAIRTSYQGNTGKRPALLCKLLGECKASYINGTSCLVRLSNSTADIPVGQLSMCSATGLQGQLVSGISNSSQLPTGRCLSTTDCTTTATGPNTSRADAAYKCSMASSQKLCTCDSGVDTCVDHGQCIQTQCGKCSTCVAAVYPFVASNQQVASAATLAGSWVTFCNKTLNRDTTTCANVASKVNTSYAGNAGRRAGALCSLLAGRWKLAKISVYQQGCSDHMQLVSPGGCLG